MTLAVQHIMLFAMAMLTVLRSLAQDSGNPFPPRERPDRIVLNVTEDPSTSMAITWRTSAIISKGLVDIMPASADPAAISGAKRLEAASTSFQLDSISAVYHSIIVKDLTPGTRYMYRVGFDNNWSEWFHFRTAGKPGERLSFIYLGDVQVGAGTLWPRVIRQAFAHMPDANAVLYAGDIVNRGDHDYEWGELFHGGGFIHAIIPGMMSPGNHEYSRTRSGGLSALWRPQFNLPENGPDLEMLKETVYFTDIQGMRFISLNSHEARSNGEALESQKFWLDSVLRNNPNKWTCIVFHHPVYSISKTRANSDMLDHFKPLFDKYSVDLVMQGHDHAYARGMKNIPNVNGKDFSGTMYVVSVSGAKMYEANNKEWMDRSGGNVQLYQLITVEGNKLAYRCYTASGDLYDSFELKKRKGRQNRLIERNKPSNHVAD